MGVHQPLLHCQGHSKFVKIEFKQCPKGVDKCIQDGSDTYNTFLTHSDVANLSTFLGKGPDTRCAYVQTISQYHRQLVHVPAGWLLQVVNPQDCVVWRWHGTPWYQSIRQFLCSHGIFCLASPDQMLLITWRRQAFCALLSRRLEETKLTSPCTDLCVPIFVKRLLYI